MENEEIWKELKKKVSSSVTEIKKKLTAWKVERKEWHSKEWKREKRYLRKMMRR